MECQLCGPVFLCSLVCLDVANLHLNVPTNFDPVVSKVIAAVWEEMTGPAAGIARVSIPQGDDLMPESAGLSASEAKL